MRLLNLVSRDHEVKHGERVVVTDQVSEIDNVRLVYVILYLSHTQIMHSLLECPNSNTHRSFYAAERSIVRPVYSTPSRNMQTEYRDNPYVAVVAKKCRNLKKK